MRRTQRGGEYYRVCDPDWADCSETSFSRHQGGRWNPPGAFGALYLNRTLEVSAAQARHNFAGELHTLFDLRPDQRPDLQSLIVPLSEFLDVVTDAGVADVGLPKHFPYGVTWELCQPIGRMAYDGNEHGIATRSAAEATPQAWIGEELALFDRTIELAPIQLGHRRRFQEWYPALQAES